MRIVARRSGAEIFLTEIPLKPASVPACLSLAKTRSMSWSIELRVPPFLGPPSAREGLHCHWRQPERVDDAHVFETSFRAGPAKKVLRDSEASCSLRRCERTLVV